jgi:hypothetical protein
MEPTLSHLQALTNTGQIAKHLMGIHINHRGANRHWQHQILAFGAGAVPPGTLLPARRFVLTLKLVIYQRVKRILCFEIYGATVAAIATIGTTSGNVFFTPKTKAAVSAIAGFNDDCGFVYEFHESTLCAWRIN